MLKIPATFLIILYFIGLNAHAQKVYFSTQVENDVILINRTSDSSYLLGGYDSPFSNSWFIRPMDKKGHITGDKLVFTGIEGLNLFNFGKEKSILLGHSTESATDTLLFVTAITNSGNKIWGWTIYGQYYKYLRQNTCFVSSDEIDLIVNIGFNIRLDRMDSIGQTISTTPVAGLKGTVLNNLIKLSANRFAFTCRDTFYGTKTQGFEAIHCIDGSGRVLWSQKFNHDTGYARFYDMKRVGDFLFAMYWVSDSLNQIQSLVIYKLDLNGSIVDSKVMIKPVKSWLVGLPNQFVLSNQKDALYFYVNYFSSYQPSELIKIDQNLNIVMDIQFERDIHAISVGDCDNLIIAFQGPDGTGAILTNMLDPTLKEICYRCNTTLYPNPNSGNFDIRLNFESVLIEDVSLWDLQGREIWKNDKTLNESVVNISNQLSSGIYLCKISCDNNQSEVKRIIISR